MIYGWIDRIDEANLDYAEGRIDLWKRDSAIRSVWAEAHRRGFARDLNLEIKRRLTKATLEELSK